MRRERIDTNTVENEIGFSERLELESKQERNTPSNEYRNASQKLINCGLFPSNLGKTLSGPTVLMNHISWQQLGVKFLEICDREAKGNNAPRILPIAFSPSEPTSCRTTALSSAALRGSSSSSVAGISGCLFFSCVLVAGLFPSRRNRYLYCVPSLLPSCFSVYSSVPAEGEGVMAEGVEVPLILLAEHRWAPIR